MRLSFASQLQTKNCWAVFATEHPFLLENWEQRNDFIAWNQYHFDTTQSTINNDFWCNKIVSLYLDFTPVRIIFRQIQNTILWWWEYLILYIVKKCPKLVKTVVKSYDIYVITRMIFYQESKRAMNCQSQRVVSNVTLM